MSTKSSLAWDRSPGRDFHLYEECFDPDAVYFELCGDDIEYEASPKRVMVKIPVDIWEEIRKCEPVYHSGDEDE